MPILKTSGFAYPIVIARLIVILPIVNHRFDCTCSTGQIHIQRQATHEMSDTYIAFFDGCYATKLVKVP